MFLIIYCTLDHVKFTISDIYTASSHTNKSICSVLLFFLFNHAIMLRSLAVGPHLRRVRHRAYTQLDLRKFLRVYEEYTHGVNIYRNINHGHSTQDH